jgi:hypothetical protein
MTPTGGLRKRSVVPQATLRCSLLTIRPHAQLMYQPRPLRTADAVVEPFVFTQLLRRRDFAAPA